MSTIRLVANAFRWIIEIVNVVAAVGIIILIFTYIFNRDQIVGAATSYGFATDVAVLYLIISSVVGYVLVMGLLCVILEIRESLKRLEGKNSDEFEAKYEGKRGDRTIDPTFE